MGILLLASVRVAAEEPPVCIRDVGGRLVMTPGDCPDPLAPVGPVRSTEGERSAPTDTPASVHGRSSLERPPEAASRSTPARRGEVEAVLRRIVDAPSEAEGDRIFRRLVTEGEAVAAPLSDLFLARRQDPRLRWVAGRALGLIRSPLASRALAQGLEDPNGMVRLAAIRAIQDQRDPGFVPGLEAALDDRAALVRAAAIDGLAQLGNRSHVGPIAAQLTSSRNYFKGQSLFVRVHAVAALERLGGAEATQALILVADDRSSEVRSAARRSLLVVSGRSGPPGGGGTEGQRWQAWWDQGSGR